MLQYLRIHNWPALIIAFFLFAFVSFLNAQSQSLEQGFYKPPHQARLNVMWWWLNSNINETGITGDLEEMKKQGIGGALIFDAAPVDRWKPKDIAPAPNGPPFMSERWRQLFRHALKEADRLDIELGVSITSGFNAGGPWVTPQWGQQEIVWSEIIVDSESQAPIQLPLPSGPIYGAKGELLRYNELQINNDLELTPNGTPVYYRDIAVLAIPYSSIKPMTMAARPDTNSPDSRILNWSLKSVHSFNYPENKGFDFSAVYQSASRTAGEQIIPLKDIRNISSDVDHNGRLDWTIPDGKWLILRFGHTHTGIRLQATNPQNKGLAMNHLSMEAAQRHFNQIALKMLEDKKIAGTQNPVYFYLDSWEVRIANWTQTFEQEFKKRRGYSIQPYLPVLAGLLVGSRDISNRFLHDYRLTIADLIADNYYGAFRQLAHKNEMQFHAEMATTPIPADMLKCLGRVDLPFGEFWAETEDAEGRDEPWERMFGKQAASAAHIYGLPYAAAEALTVIQKHWEQNPFRLKKTIDQALCSGLNRLMIHTFTHSPPDVKPPGYEYFAGTHFNPQITWWDQAHAFTEYIARCQYLLQQGNFVADVCYYQGDRIPAFVPNKHIPRDLVFGYDYDIINTEVLLERISVKHGWLVLPDGLRYRMLVLPDDDRINPLVLKKIAQLVRQGATVLGPKPARSYGLQNYPQSDSLVIAKANRLWSDCDTQKIDGSVPKIGKIICGKTAYQVLTEAGITPDFFYEEYDTVREIDFIHRRINSTPMPTDIYFVVNSTDRWQNLHCAFRIADRRPELWDPVNGEIKIQNIYRRKQNQIFFPLRLAPHGSKFIVFSKPFSEAIIKQIVPQGIDHGLENKTENKRPVVEILQLDEKITLEIRQSGEYQVELITGNIISTGPVIVPPAITINGPWKIFFPPEFGAPDSTVLDQLISWTDSEIEGVKYFSGTACYYNEFDLPESGLHENIKYVLDLGQVHDLAQITVNNNLLPVLWKPPYRQNISKYLQSGGNTISIAITNLWPNRLIGDQQLPVNQRVTFTNIAKFKTDAQLLRSGLIGPVRLHASRLVNLEY